MDFSAIRIGRLTAPCSVDTVMQLLSEVGLSVSKDKVRLIHHPATKQCSGIITKKDPEFAQTACHKLRTCITNEGLEIVPTSVRLPQSSNTHRFNCTQVRCSWDRPKRTATLYFQSQMIASGVHKRFSMGKYKVMGSVVPNISINPKALPPCENPWILQMKDLWQVSEMADITRDLSAQDMPFAVELGEPTYKYDIDMQSTQVRSMLDEFGLLDKWHIIDDPKNPSVVAKATFVEQSSALEAAFSLKERSLPFYTNGRIHIKNDVFAEIIVSCRVYDITKDQIKNNEGSWDHQGVRLIIQQKGAQRILRLEGINNQCVAKAQQELKHIVSGKIIKMQGLEMRCMDFSVIGRIGRALPKVEKKHGVLIAQEKQASQFRLFGPPTKFKRVTEELRRLVQEMASTTYRIQLQEDSEFEWATQGGFKALQLHLGRNRAVFDKVSKVILVFGTTKDYDEAKVIMARRQLKPTAYQADCPICFCAPEEAFRTSCCHIFCNPCFSNMCLAAARESKPIKCEGAGGQCENIIPLPEISRALSPEVFEEVLSISFSSHIKTHPDLFRHCPTPDCDQIYRVTPGAIEAARAFTCGQCLKPTCTTCHVSHPGLSCNQREGYVAGEIEELKKAKNDMGAKDCAKCGTSIQKGEGCNHVICGGCKADMCWVCEAVFSRSEDCYEHMRRLHGGIHG